MSTWECLPDDILDEISNNVISLLDLIRFGAVCKAWHAVFLQKKRLRTMEGCNKEVPLLFIPTNFIHIDPPAEQNASTIINTSPHVMTRVPNQLFNMFETKCYNSMSPVTPFRPSDSPNFSASYGWLATIIPEGHDVIIILNHPITGNTITLPTLFHVQASCISMVVLSCDPAIYPDKCVVAYANYSSIGFIRLGGKKWNELKVFEKAIAGIIFHKGKLYALDHRMNLIAIDCHWESINGDKCAFKSCCGVEINADVHQRLYLVESGRGELLMIKHTDTFMVYKLVMTHEDENGNMKGCWVQTDRLGNDEEVLFLSRDHNAICSKCRNLRPNSVYYVTYSGGNCGLKVYRLNILPDKLRDIESYKLRKALSIQYGKQGEIIELGVTLRKLAVYGLQPPLWIKSTLQ